MFVKKISKILSKIFRKILTLLNRETIGFVISILPIILGIKSSWYNLPPKAAKSLGIDNILVINLEKGVLILLAIIILVALVKKNSKVIRLSLWTGLIVAILFPYLITTWSPKVSYLASSYDQQGRTAAGAVERNYSEVLAQWKKNINLGSSAPITSVADFYIPNSGFFQLSSLDKIFLDGFGYKDSFFTFIGKGWSLTIIGSAICLMTIYLRAGIKSFYYDLSKVLPIASVLIGVITISMIWANVVNYRLDTLYAQGQYEQVIKTSKTLLFWYPPFKGDETFLKRLGEASYYSGQEIPSLINFVLGWEQYQKGDFSQAETYFNKSLELDPDLFLVKGYLASTIINHGVEYFKYTDGPKLPTKSAPVPYKRSFLDSLQGNKRGNNPRPAIAAEFFERALEVFPGHMEALNNLMLARVVNSQYEESAKVAKEIIEIEQYFQRRHIALLGQAYTHLTWADYHNDDIEKAWKRYRQTVDSGVWSQDYDREETEK